MPALEPAVTYYRMSRDRQEASIPAQREEVEAYAARHGYTIIREYADEGISGDATEKRLDFQRMLRDAAERRDFRVVLCWDQDRFGRFDPLEAGYWVKPLRDADVRLETVAQGRIDWNDFAGRIIYAVQQEGKHAYLRDLSRNATRGMIAAAKQGRRNGGKRTYGYSLRDKRLADGPPEEAEVVRWLFQTYAHTDASTRGLAAALNARGIPAPGGGRWTHMSVRCILRKPAYLGLAVWNQAHKGKYHGVVGGAIEPTGRNGKEHWNPEADWITRPGSHPPLVDRETWDKVQRRLAENKDRKGRRVEGKGRTYLLSGLVYCAHCGRKMWGDPRETPRYICSGYQAHGKAVCTKNVVPEAALGAAVVRKIQLDFCNPENCAKLRAAIRRRLATKGKASARRAKELAAQIADLGQKIEQGAERYLTAPAALLPALNAKLEDWRRQQERLRRELDALNAPGGGDEDARVEEAVAQLATLHERLSDADPARRRAVVNEVVSRVDCWFEREEHGSFVVTRFVRAVVKVRPDAAVTRLGSDAEPRLPVRAVSLQTRSAGRPSCRASSAGRRPLPP
jgi:DNA invertase Pin-like site-specific DNA recombinase